MALIEWKPEYEIGIASVDHEHRSLIALINQLYDTLSHQQDRDRVIEVLGEINARIAAHFALEENEMRAMGYDAFEDHKADHERLLDEIRDIMDEVERDAEAEYALNLGKRLDAWFTDHFRTKDAKLHHFLKDLR